ncbi:hypothetical protein RSAG8_12016, partial [Rhizoctonia solani AG-8 WAC10335]
MDDKRVPPRGEFLAHGAAAEVWLVDTPGMDGSKCVLKIVRLSLETLQDNHDPKASAITLHCHVPMLYLMTLEQGPKKASELWKDFINAFRSKVDQWKPLAHPNVVQMLGIYGACDLYVEHVANGTARQYLAERSNHHIPLRMRMIGDILSGLDYLHSRDPAVVHGCIRMDKLFVDSQGTTKIGEFGLASLFEGFDLFAPSVSQVGRIRWMSPELLEENALGQRPAPTTESDIWSLGCTLFEIMSGKLPYFRCKRDLQVRRAMISERSPGEPEDLLSPEFVAFWTLLTPCWKWTPEQRSPVKELIELSRRLASTGETSQLQVSEWVPQLSYDGLPQGLFGLVIGIDTYSEASSLGVLAGAVNDANDMGNGSDYPGISSAVQLIKIERGDPILIYYAGYGGSVEVDEARRIQVIFPYDYGCQDTGSTERTTINCIPDKTILRLLNDLAAKKGNNITVIFDSCHSASSSRDTELDQNAKSVDRRVRAANVKFEIPFVLDDDIFAPDDPMSLPSEGQQRDAELLLCVDQTSHVHLAACDVRQKAFEENGQGVFTAALLKKIRESRVDNITYHNLMKSLEMSSEEQSPQCYGKHKNRKLFNSRISSPHMAFIPVNLKEGEFILAAGAASGVTVGSTWELYKSPTVDSPSVGKFKVGDLYGSTAILQAIGPVDGLPEGDSDSRWYARCIQVGPGNELRVWMSPDDRKLLFQDQGHVGGAQGTGIGYVITATRDSADVALEVRYPDPVLGAKSTAQPEVVFYWCDPLAVKYGVAELKHRKPARREEVETVLFAAAKWRWHLRRGNSQGRLPEQGVTMSMLKVGNRVNRRRTYLLEP